jgi:hypothetical protein
MPEKKAAALFSGTYPKSAAATFPTSLRSIVKMSISMSLESGKVVPSTCLGLHKRKNLSVAWYTFPGRNEEACVGLLVGSYQPLLVWRATFFIP